MPSLVIAIGNPLRADDGVAHNVAGLITGATLLRIHQLTPEIAADLQNYDPVIFLDADCAAAEPSLELIEAPRETAAALSHAMTVETVVAIAARMFHFHGEAWICRLPARDFTAGSELSREAAGHVEAAASLVRQFLEARCTSPR